MIHRITANKSSFHPVEFTPGLNVVLADRTDTSTQKDTRNGLGKSTLIDIIDFCLGSNVRTRSRPLYRAFARLGIYIGNYSWGRSL